MLHNQQQSQQAMDCDDGIPDEHKIRSDIEFINALLTKLRMESPLAILSGKPQSNPDLTTRWELGQLCSVLIPLLSSKSREQAFRSDVEDRVRRLAEDLQERTHQLSQNKSRVQELEREVKQLQVSLQQSNEKCKAAETAASKAKEESARLRAAFQLKEKQFVHELRKKELEFDKLKEQLQTHFNREILAGTGVDKAELARLSLHPQDSATSRRLSIHGEMIQQQEQQQQFTSSEETIDRIGGLEEENEQMRELLLSMKHLLAELKTFLELDHHDDDSEYYSKLNDTGILTMPTDWVLDEIKADIENSLSLLSNRVAHICGIPMLQHQ